jgi:hypothetical protein
MRTAGESKAARAARAARQANMKEGWLMLQLKHPGKGLLVVLTVLLSAKRLIDVSMARP